MDRAKLIEKIQKCLNLSKSPEPHEAAAALRQAQKLMAAHGVTDKELGLAEYVSEAVDCPVQAGKTMPANLTQLVSLMQRAFGVRATVRRTLRETDWSWTITYYGKADRVALAAYSHPVVWRAMDGAWSAHLKRNPYLRGQRGARSGFHIGWLLGVQRTVETIGLSDEENAAIDAKWAEHGVDGKTESADIKLNLQTARAGLQAAKDFSLHRPIGG